MKYSDIQKLTIETLKQKVAEERETLGKLKFAHALSPIENPMRIQESRKLIARLLTALHTKEIAKS
jgi:large subunit ribosomal protein L29